METYAQVLVPVPVGDSFTYLVPGPMVSGLRSGMRVIVPFGRGKFYTGIVESIHNHCPEGYEVKAIVHVPDNTPVVRHPQLNMWRWMADYYMCSPGDVMRAAIPAGLKIESETNVEINPDMESDEAAAVLTERELLTWQTLEHEGRLSLAKLGKAVGNPNITAQVNRMIEKGAVIVSEKLIERFRAKTETCVRLTLPRGDSVALRKAFTDVRRAPKQERMLQTLVALSGFTQVVRKPVPVTRAELLEKSGGTAAVLQGLLQRGVAETFKREISRFSYDGPVQSELPDLSQAQQTALTQIHETFRDHAVTLLHGVTSSGKTELYIHLIDYVLQQGRQVLYLVPEIALTTQLTQRLQKVFGRRVLIYHSRFSDNERVEVWQRLLKSSDPCVVIGARSSVFLPFGHLGLVIVDEEHESSYKQYDPAPRYNGRDCGILLASMHGARTLLGSATPAVETYWKATNGKYGLVTLSERYAGMELPQVNIVDMNNARNRRQVTGPFANSTLESLRQTVSGGNQAIVFHNRRGYAPVATCRQCGYTPKCKYCDVTLTYHRRLDRMVCHYCSATYELPKVCPVCGTPQLAIAGYGTERLEENLEELLPGMKLLRMDLDTTRNKDNYAHIIDDFSERKADVLVGTQMVTKGLDFGAVSNVVVLDADAVISYPDFRSAERAFNMLEQVSGRAGRKDNRGVVNIQTRTPDHPVLRHVLTHNYHGFYNLELENRRKYFYPPFSRVIYIYIKHRDPKVTQELASQYAAELRTRLGGRVFGPQEPMVARVQNLYIRRIMLKIEPSVSMKQVREILRNVFMTMSQNRDMVRSTLYYDVDPY